MIPASDVKIPDQSKVTFCGWEFKLSITKRQDASELFIVLCSFHRLENPEAPGLIYSTCYRTIPDCFNDVPTWIVDEVIKECCAWLMSHWWEHKLEVCPCQNGKADEEGNFRIAFMREILSSRPPLLYGVQPMKERFYAWS